MGRFSPTVAPLPDTGLANALGNFTETYMQFAARRRQRDLDAVETGIGLTPGDGSAPQTTPSGPIASLRARLSGRTNPNDIASAVRNAAPAVQGANAVNSGVADALSRGESYTPDTSGVPQLPGQMRLPSGQTISTAMTPIGQRLAQQRLAALGMGSEIALRQSETAKNTREAGRLQLGDPGYAAATGEVEAAKATATLPADIRKMVINHQLSESEGQHLALLRGQIDANLQGNQQQFTAGQNALNRTAESDRQTVAKGQELTNRLTEIGATQDNQLGPQVLKFGRKFLGRDLNVRGVTEPQAAPAALPGGKQPITSAEAAKLKSLGHTDADIFAHYVVTDGR